MDKKLFTIGEVSQIKGITKKALRFYDRIGLLKPSFVNPENGYRFYSTEQFVQIDIIRALREISVSPPEIRMILAKKNTDELMEFLDAQRHRVVERIEVLQRMTETIINVQNSIRDSISSVAHKKPYRKQIETRHILTLPYNDLVDYDEAIVEFSKFDNLIDKYRLVNAFQTGILFEQRAGVSHPSKIFNTVEANKLSNTSVVKILPAGEYVCICYSAANAIPQLRKINRYCEKNDVVGSVIVQIELLNDIFATDSTMVELQILVEEVKPSAT